MGTMTDRERELCIKIHGAGVMPDIQKGDWLFWIKCPSEIYLASLPEVLWVNQEKNRPRHILIWTIERCLKWLKERGIELTHLHRGDTGGFAVGFDSADGRVIAWLADPFLEAVLGVVNSVAEEEK